MAGHTKADCALVRPCLGTFSGRIKSFSPLNGYGFIECPELRVHGYQDAFLHHSQLQHYIVGNSVLFTCYLSNKGQPQACDLKSDGVIPQYEQPEPAANHLGRYVGVVKSFNPEKGYGFISSPQLRERGYESDVFVHHTQVLDFKQGSVVGFQAYVDSKNRLKGRALQSAEEQDVTVGSVAVARQVVKAVCGGYLGLEIGAEVEVLYTGNPTDEEERDWLFGRKCSDGSEGWLPCSAVVRSESAHQPGELPESGAQAGSTVTQLDAAPTESVHQAVDNSAPPRCAAPERPCPEAPPCQEEGPPTAAEPEHDAPTVAAMPEEDATAAEWEHSAPTAAAKPETGTEAAEPVHAAPTAAAKPEEGDASWAVGGGVHCP